MPCFHKAICEAYRKSGTETLGWDHEEGSYGETLVLKTSVGHGSETLAWDSPVFFLIS